MRSSFGLWSRYFKQGGGGLHTEADRLIKVTNITKEMTKNSLA